MIEPSDLNLREPPPLGGTGEGDARLQSVERDMITQALSQAGGNVTVAADALGISRDTLRYRMERHAIRRSEFVDRDQKP